MGEGKNLKKKLISITHTPPNLPLCKGRRQILFFIPLLMQEGFRGGIPLLTHTLLPASPYARGGVKRVSPLFVL